MKKINFANIILLLSIIVFIANASALAYNHHAKAVAGQSGGGRIGTVLQPLPQPCVPQYCTCSATYAVTLMPSSGTVNIFCPATAAMPKTGQVINMSSVGLKVLGNWTQTQPMAVSSNWGTSMSQ